MTIELKIVIYTLVATNHHQGLGQLFDQEWRDNGFQNLPGGQRLWKRRGLSASGTTMDATDSAGIG